MSQYPLSEQLAALQQLQALDLKIESAKKKKSALPAALAQIETKLLQAKKLVDAKQNEIKEIEKNKGQTQAAIDLNTDRQTRANTKLESVTTGPEFQAATKEVDQLKKLNETLNEQIKKFTADADSAKKILANYTADYEKIKADRDSQSGILNGQGSEIDHEIEGFLSERAPYVVRVDKRVLAQYDRIRPARGGLGFTAALAGRCTGCNMSLPPQTYNMILRNQEIQSCPVCHRILFVPSGTTVTTASSSVDTGFSSAKAAAVDALKS